MEHVELELVPFLGKWVAQESNLLQYIREFPLSIFLMSPHWARSLMCICFFDASILFSLLGHTTIALATKLWQLHLANSGALPVRPE